MSAADWYARKLGQPQVQQPRPSTPGPLPGYAPQQQAPAPAYVPPYQPAMPYGQPQPAHQVAPGPPVGKEAVIDAIFNRPDVWQGRGPSTKANEVYNCPNCGSPHFFTRTGMGSVMTQNGPVAPAPICDSCGYNGRFEQFGTQEG